MQTTAFRPKVFWISYVVISLVALGFGYTRMDVGDANAILVSIVFPVPFLLLGYFAPHIRFSSLYALAIIVASLVVFFFLLPTLARVGLP